MQCRWVASLVFTMSQHSSMVRAAGTSMATWCPCFMPATAMGTCQIHGVAITTRSISSRFSRPSNAWSSERNRAIGCEALPALSSFACVFSTLSFTVSHSAAIRTPGTMEKLSTSELPRPPVPMTPIRIVSLGSNGISATLLPPPDCDRARVAPSDPRPTSFNKSRREELSIAWLLLPEFPDHLNHDKPADRENAAQNQRISRSPVQHIADCKQRRPDHRNSHRPARERQRDIVAFHSGDAGPSLNVPPAGTEGADLFVKLQQHRLVGPRAQEGRGDPGDGGNGDADQQLFGEAEDHAVPGENQEDDGHAERADHGHDLAPRRDAPPEPAQQIQQTGSRAHLQQQVETVLGGGEQKNHT